MTLCEHINSMTYTAYLKMKNSKLGRYKALIKLMKICLINTVEKLLSKLKKLFPSSRKNANNFQF